jgi:sugar O-acyltransferase (sialic acid O-acetyltransferase NeuD family)
MKDIILVGGGGHCVSCIDVIEQEKLYRIKGIIQKTLNNKKDILGYPVIGLDLDLQKIVKKNTNILIATGQIKSPKIRIKLFNLVESLGAKFPIIKSPKSYCSKYSQISHGTILMHYSLVNSNVKIGKNCIINSKSLIEHDVVISDHVHISTGAILNGGVKVGSGSFIGSGAIIKEGVEIGKNVVIGAGKIILNNITNNKVIK